LRLADVSVCARNIIDTAIAESAAIRKSVKTSATPSSPERLMSRIPFMAAAP
jgi:hypothetical protein